MPIQKNQIKKGKLKKNQGTLDRFLTILWRREIDFKLNVK